MKFDYDNIENSIEGYKYVVEISVNVEDPLNTSDGDRLFICDTRDEAIEQIKKDLEYQLESYKKDGIEPSEYNITRLGTIIKFTKDDKSWWWNYGIYPVKYVSNEK